MQGKIIKGIAGFYYVQTKTGIYECKAKGSFRNRKVKPYVGDNVEITVLNEETKKGNLEDILERKNFLIRPDFVAYKFADRKTFSNFLVRKLWGAQGVTWTIQDQASYDQAVAEGWLPIFEGFRP